MKKRKSSKTNQENPNQLNLEFLFREPSIVVHIPRTNLKNFDARLTTPKRLTIKLAQN
jgi:hypothetical protein